MYLLGRGIERIAEEFGRTFPNTQIHIATANKEIEGEVSKRSIVLSTVGVAPIMKYSATFFLDGLNLGSDMRNEERFLSILCKYSALSNGNVLMVERSESPVVNALIKWNPFSLLRRLVADLSEAGLPPSSRHILIKSDESDRIFTGLQSALRESRIPANTRIHNLGDGIISIFFTLKDAKSVIGFIYELQRRRSMAGKELLKVRIDPYLLG
jgi:primosomal protein N' (replication factor Y)